MVCLQDLAKKPVPFKSPSAVLQEHVNPEHAEHFANVAKDDKDVDSRSTGGDLPSSTPHSKV